MNVPAAPVRGVTSARVAPSRRWNPLAVVVVVLGLILAAVLSWITYAVNSHNERRLLNLQVEQASTVIQVALPTIQTALASAVEIATNTDGSPARFRSYMSDYVGAPPATFVSGSLWRIDGARPRLLAVVGQQPDLGSDPAVVARLFAPAAAKTVLHVAGPLGAGPTRRLGYGVAATGAKPRYAVYAESALPADKKVKTPKSTPFGDLRFALYLGHAQTPAQLLEANVDLPVPGPTSTVSIPFGTSSFTLVAGANGQLGGSLSAALWWIVALAGLVLSLLSGFATNRLIQRRRAAEQLIDEVQFLLSEQRGIAESLQRALLPHELPDVPGVDLGVRYIPGFVGVEIGGDWYDVIQLEAGRFFFVVGDVSGRGVAAGTVMAALHFAIRAFVSEGHQPAEVLNALSGLLDVTRDHHFATVLCGIADVTAHELTMANAGHLPPLLISAEGSDFLATKVGPPIGVKGAGRYEQVTLTVPAKATVLSYTDGLIERRGETLDDGMNRLQELTVDANTPLESLLGTLVSTLGRHDSDDDTAILGMRWVI